MRIAFEGLDGCVETSPRYVSTLEIANKTMFTRICRSLLSCEGENALEPYSLWGDDGEELKPSAAFLFVPDPLDLPWDDKRLGGKLYKVMEQLAAEDEETRQQIEALGVQLARAVETLTYQVNADYDFGVEWCLRQYLKSFSFSVDRLELEPYLDSLISFLDFCADMSLRRVIAFVNLKNFLEENDLEELFERAIFHGLQVLLLESSHCGDTLRFERKTYVDQHFLESCSTNQQVCTSLTQRGICSNGFGAVTS